jgi:hypothetical protein
VENRNGLIAAAMVTHADGYAERDAALLMLAEKQQDRSRRITVGGDKAYDTEDFVYTVRELNVTPHVTRNNKNRSSNRPDGREQTTAKGLSNAYLQILRRDLAAILEQSTSGECAHFTQDPSLGDVTSISSFLRVLMTLYCVKSRVAPPVASQTPLT